MLFIVFIISFLVTAISEKFTIPVLHKLKFGQYIREEGPESHKKKAGTPTMGGVCIILGFLISCIVAVIMVQTGDNVMIPETGYSYKDSFIKGIIIILLLTVGYGIVGFLDDFLKIKKKNNEGLSVLGKLTAQLIVTGAFIALLIIWGKSIDVNYAANYIKIPFMENMILVPMVIFVIFLLIVLLGTDNGTNLTDGLDGLLSFVSLPVAVCLCLMGMLKKAYFFSSAGYASPVSVAAVAMLGALIGFLIYNHYPAKVFMGDTGSLAIGGFVAACACILHVEIFIILFGFIYLMESVSVILQVGYFKISHGKRIFRMAPIHHHYEKGGWKETKVVTVFTIVSLIGSILAFVIYYIK
ncbi:MAG: phospho-N-acetylmuramoyl-pentapeptide-transferase [Lachnospiraceae bacterium]|nr:phospho-N-acetylmuramoyl-pentapeptide-transferase [Lachnospiraceae bacterium]